MPDISMCKSKNCPLKEKCYRYMAKPSDMQSYSNFEEIRSDLHNCEDFVEIIYTEELDSNNKNPN